MYPMWSNDIQPPPFYNPAPWFRKAFGRERFEEVWGRKLNAVATLLVSLPPPSLPPPPPENELIRQLKRDENWTIGNETSEPTINFQGTFVSFLGGYLLGGWKKYENIFPQVWWFNLVVESNKKHQLNKQKFTGLYKLEFPNWNSNYFMEGFLKNNLSKDTNSRLVARVYLPTSIP